LKLGDKSPGEIAISVLAEVLLVKSRGELAHNRLPPREAREEQPVVEVEVQLDD
jgi:xanthine/CO dehydrogenase XdhC/CoxF family maturation factor